MTKLIWSVYCEPLNCFYPLEWKCAGFLLLSINFFALCFSGYVYTYFYLTLHFMSHWLFHPVISLRMQQFLLVCIPKVRLYFSGMQWWPVNNRVFPILYWISLISNIRWIQLESTKHGWRLLKAFLCLPFTVGSLV